VPFDDIVALRAALAGGEIACIIAEPAMTNCGMILPEEGFHAAMREAATEAGALLLIDETHTISAGLGGYTAVHGLRPDILVVGKPVGGGIPVSVWGMTNDVATRFAQVRAGGDVHGHSGIGTTLSGSAFQLLCLRACLEEVMTPDAYDAMTARADQIEVGFGAAIAKAGLPWRVSRIGARIEVIFSDRPVRNATEARNAASSGIEAAIHLALLNQRLSADALSQHGSRCADAFVDAYSAVLRRLVTS
jgi:glutamate-1-semialdehyde 2,1-aminomutase